MKQRTLDFHPITQACTRAREATKAWPAIITSDPARYRSDPTTGKYTLDQDALTAGLVKSGHSAGAIPGILESLSKAQDAKNKAIKGQQEIQQNYDDHIGNSALANY